MKVHGTEIPAVVKQNNKGQTATEPPAKKGQQQQKSQQQQQQLQLQHHSRERGASHEGGGEEHFKSPDSVKSELTEEGVAGAELYSSAARVKLQQPDSCYCKSSEYNIFDI